MASICNSYIVPLVSHIYIMFSVSVSETSPVEGDGMATVVIAASVAVILVLAAILAILIMYKRKQGCSHQDSEMNRSYDTETAALMMNGSTTVGTSLNEMLEFSNSGSGSG